MELEQKFRELLLPVLGFDEVSEIPVDASLVNDLGADSLDFVEIVYVIEKIFGVVLKTNEIILGGESISQDEVFEDGCLTEIGFGIIKNKFPDSSSRFKTGMTKVELFSSITVRDIINIIEMKLNEEQ
ncbi:acyl carrier protein [Bacteroidota bacterium]